MNANPAGCAISQPLRLRRWCMGIPEVIFTHSENRHLALKELGGLGGGDRGPSHNTGGGTKLIHFALLLHSLIVASMATPSGSGGIPLTEFRRDLPPGWEPGDPNYSLTTYFQRLRLWYRQTEVPDECVGPIVAGRLGPRAQRVALELRLVRPDGQVDVGDAALVRLSVDEVRDPADPAQILQHAIPSGVQALCNALRAAFGQTDEQLLTKALEAFFDFKRKNAMTLQEFSLEWDLRFEEAQTRAGLDMNMVGRSYLWLKQSNMSQKFCDDLKLQVQGDMSRFNDIRTLALRLAHQHAEGHKGDILYGEDSRAEEHEMDPNSEDYFDYQAADSMYYWYDGDDWWSPDHDYQDYYEDYVIEDWWYDESDWQEDATADQATSWTADFDKPDPENQDPGNAEVYGKGFNKGKGKGKGKSKGKFKGKYSGPRYYNETNEMNQANRGAKNLSFSFHVGLYKTGGDSSDEVYHTVGGHRRRGLIIDPGAANSLVGTETLRDLVDHCDQSSVIKTSMQSEVTGISGQSDPILGQVTLPLPMFEELSKATYTADVIGGNASLCPALVGNPGLVGMRAVIASAWFQNNDGLLILPKDKEMKTFSLYRLLLTDSKHYLLPVDNKLHSENEEHRKAATFLSNVQEQSTKKWSDTKYSVWHSEGQSPGRKRSEPPESPSGKQEHLSIVDGTGLEPEDYWTVDFGDDGSSRLSLLVLISGLMVAFPVDLRYGWDIGNKHHQELLLHAQDLIDPDVILMQRVDQCMHGACDENRIPIMKPTGLQANMALRNSCKRCQGRHRDHSQLQGSDHLGRQRTIMAAVYPRGFCKAIIADIKRFIAKPSRGHEDYHIYYKCDRCRLGREAPPGTQHSLVPRECRHASSLPTPETSSAKVSRNVTTTLPDLMEQFKREAMRHPTTHDIKLAMDYEMPAIDTLMLKLLFLKVVEEGVNVIEAHKQKYRHWTEDPVYLAIARKIFKKVLDVKGICCTLHDDEIPVPMPYVRTASAPSRLVFKGDVKCWTALTLEDIRTLSQPRTKIMHDGWLIAVFGSAPNDQDHWEIDEAAGILRRHHVKARLDMFVPTSIACPIPTEQLTEERRTDSYRHLMGEDRWTGVTEFKVVQEKADEEEITDPVQRLAEESEKQQAQEEEEDTTMDIAEGDADQGGFYTGFHDLRNMTIYGQKDCYLVFMKDSGTPELVT
ncbi:unnamed protein product [Effrenium voratum]|nr:unnamed protein product [Effrenium voratum]